MKMGLHLAKQRSQELKPGNKISSDDPLENKQKKILKSSKDRPWKRIKFRRSLNRKTTQTTDQNRTDEIPNNFTVLEKYPECHPRQTQSLQQRSSSIATAAANGKATEEETSRRHTNSVSFHSALNIDELRHQTCKTRSYAESTETVEFERTDSTFGNWSTASEFHLSGSTSDSSRFNENIVDQTVAFLAYEIEPYLIEEFRQSIAHLGMKGSWSQYDLSTSDRIGIGRDDVCCFLSRLIRNSTTEEYRSFCELLREYGNEHYIADFLEVLSVLISLKKELPVPNEKRNSGYGSMQTSSNWIVIPDDQILKQCNCAPFANIRDKRFDLHFFYVDRESRIMKSFKGIATLKRRRYRKSRAAGTGQAKIQLGDFSDRFVPMISVHLYAQCMCEGRIRRLQRLLERYSCIWDLSIVKTSLEDQAKVRLSRAVEQNIGLYKLDLSLSSMGNDGAMYLASALRSNQYLKCLNLSGNELSARGCDLLIKGLMCRCIITDLDLGFNDVGDRGSLSIAGALQSSRCNLQRLKLRNNSITSNGATAIFTSLRNNSRLCFLDLSSNDIGDESLLALSKVLLYNRTLTDLVIDSCHVTQNGCHFLSRPLKINTVLKRLSMNANNIGDTGLAMIVDGLKYNRSVTEISLNMCGITNFGLWHLLDTILYNGAMKTIKLCYNFIDISPNVKNGDVRHLFRDDRRSSAFASHNVTSGYLSTYDRRLSLYTNHDTVVSGESQSFARFGNHVSAPSSVGRNELYAKLVEVLHSNSPLKVVLWGNRLDDSNYKLFDSFNTEYFDNL